MSYRVNHLLEDPQYKHSKEKREKWRIAKQRQRAKIKTRRESREESLQERTSSPREKILLHRSSSPELQLPVLGGEDSPGGKDVRSAAEI